MAQTCSGEEVGREDTREKEEEEADVMRCGVLWCGVVWCGVVWCGDKRWKGQSTPRTASKLFLFFSCREISRAGSLCMCCVCVKTVQC